MTVSTGALLDAHAAERVDVRSAPRAAADALLDDSLHRAPSSSYLCG